MNSEKRKRLSELFWKGETSEAEEKWLKEHTSREEDVLLSDYFGAMRYIADEKSGTSGRRAAIRPLRSRIFIWSTAAALAAFIAGFLFFSNILFEQSSVPGQAGQLSEEEYNTAVATMAKFHDTWERGTHLASMDKVHKAWHKGESLASMDRMRKAWQKSETLVDRQLEKLSRINEKEQ